LAQSRRGVFGFSLRRKPELKMAAKSHLLTSAESKSPERLLFSREQVAAMLGGISTATVRRMEADGRLHLLRLTGRRTGQVFYRRANVLALIEQASGDADERRDGRGAP
jgi:hypothetical protein